MADRGRVHDANAFVPGLPPFRVFEKAGAASEEDWNDVDVHLVDQTRAHVLLSDVGTATQTDVLPVGSFRRTLQRGVNPVGDKVEGGSAFHLDGIARVMSQDEHRRVEGWVVAPPAPPRVSRPGALAATEHMTAHDGCAKIVEILREDV